MKITQILSFILYILLVITELFPLRIQNLALLFFVAWFMVSWIAFPMVFKEASSQRRYHFLIIFLVFYFLSSTFGKNLFQGTIYTLYMMRVVSPILLYDIIRRSTIKIQRLFVITLLGIFVLYAYWMYQIINNYGAELGLKNSVMGNNTDQHIASVFGYIYSLPILAVSMILYIRTIFKKKRGQNKLLAWGRIVLFLFFFVVFSVLVFKSLFMTATVLLIIGIGIGLFYERGKRWIYKSLIALALMSVVFVVQYDSISGNVSGLGSESTDQRIEEIYNVLTGKVNQTEDVTSRSGLRMTSFYTFLNHPLFGANHLVGFDRYDNKLIGNHAEWFDLLALYGIFALLIFYLVYKTLKLQYKDTGCYAPAIIYVCTGFLNPMFIFTVNLTMFVICPLLSIICEYPQSESKTRNVVVV